MNLLKKLMMISIILLLFSACASTGKKYDKHLDIGNNFYNKGDYQNAMLEYEKAIKLDPIWWGGYLNKGICYYQMGEYDNAIHEYNEAIRLGPSAWEPHACIADTYLQMGEYDSAIESCNNAIKLNPKIWNAYFCKGNAYYNIGNYYDAINEYDKAMQCKPGNDGAYWVYYNRGSSYHELGKYENAIRDYDEAIRINKSLNFAFNARGWTYAHMGQYEKALSDSNKAIDIEATPDNFDTRAFIYFGLGEYNKALIDQNKAIELIGTDLKKNNAQHFSFRGDLHIKLGNYDSAISDYITAMQLNPNYSKAADGLALALSKRGSTTVVKLPPPPVQTAKVAVGSISITSDTAGIIIIDGKETSYSIKAQGSLKIDNVHTGNTEIALKLADGKIGRKLTAVVREGQMVQVNIKYGPATSAILRYALIIGNADYSEFSKLPNTVNDARDIAASLEKAGFKVNLLLNADRRKMQDAILQFRDNLSRNPQATEGFIWYAGHGIQHNGENYLVPLDSGIKHVDYLETDALSLAFLMNSLKRAGNKTNIVVLDACRNNPLAGSRGGTRGLTVVGYEAIPQSTLILYSTAANEEAADGARGERNSPFARAFLNNINSETEFELIFKAIVRDTLQFTKNKQALTRYGLIYDNFYF